MKKTLLIILSLLSFYSQAQITGKVFRDYNGDGIQQTSGALQEPDAEGIIVSAYDSANTLISSTTTASNGTYALPFTVSVRVEFEVPTTSCLTRLLDYSSVLPNGENIRFINATTANVNYAIQNPAEYNTVTNPFSFVPRFNTGDPLASGTSATSIGFFGQPFASTGKLMNGFIPTYQLASSNIGSVWGTVYSKHAQKLFTAAFLKRFTGLGPLGSGGIYMLEPNGSSFIVTPFYDMDAHGFRTRASSTAVPYALGSSFNINAAGTHITYLGPIDPVSGSPEGLGVIGSNGAGGRNIISSSSNGTVFHDSTAMGQTCKVGLGDLEISDDGRFLFVTNLYDQKVYRLELDNAMNPQSVVTVTAYSLPSITVTNGVLRSFALCSHYGKLYIGAVSTGENGGQNSLNGSTDMYAYVFEMLDPMGNPSFNANPILTLPLNYHKGSAGGAILDDRWYPWTDSITTNGNSYPTPVLSNIGFTKNDDIILDFMDRSGHQFGYLTQKLLSGSSLSDFIIGGDILIAGSNCMTGAYSIEQNGSYLSSNGTTYSGGVNNNQGIGGGEFFYGDAGFEAEGSVGSLAMIPRSDSFLTTMMDPDFAVWDNGTAMLNSTNGAKTSTLILTMLGTSYGKGNSLGDIELSGDAPLIQIGNRIWLDANNNGIQDPGESGINNVTVELFADFNNDGIPDGPTLGTSITNGDGNYSFDWNNVLDGDPVTPLAQAGPVANRTYLIRIANTDWSSGAGINNLLGYSLSLQNVGGIGQPDLRDNDAQLLNAIPTIQMKTGMNGQNDHSNDMGFIQCKALLFSDITLDCTTTSMQIGPAADSGYTYQWSPSVGLSATNIAQPLANPNSTTTYTLMINGFCTYTLNVNVDNVPPIADAGSTQNLDCTVKSAQLGTAAQANLTYHWEPSNSLDNPNTAQPIASPVTTTNYTLTVSGLNGCTSQSAVTVEVNECCTKLVVPNSFSPNDDHINDEFGVIEIENIQEFTLAVYNRWGQKLFETNKKELKWDGKYNNKDCEVGTYFYKLLYNCLNKKEKKMIKGDVTLLR